MQPLYSKKIPNTVMPFPKDDLQEKTQTKLYFSDLRALMKFSSEVISRVPEAVLLKYYPKYCRSLYFNCIPKSRAVLSRIKQMKIIENIELKGRSEEKKSAIKKMKQLLRNKRKTVRSLPLVHCDLVNAFPINMCSSFPRIQNLKILPLYSLYFNREKCFSSPSLERKTLKFYGYFWVTLRSVQHLVLSNLSYNLWLLLPRLQSSKRFLASLKSFRLEVGIPFSTVQKNIPLFTLQILLRNQDLLRYVTHLKFKGFREFHYYGTQVKSVLDYCSSLISLSFPVRKDFNRPDIKHLSLAPLQSFQNVRVLTVRADDNWSFIEAFEFPSSLQKLVLRLENQFSWFKVWYALYTQVGDDPIDEDTIRSYEEYQVLLSFFEKFKALTLLTSLNLSMPLFVIVNEMMDNFILPILRAIPNLENFECQFSLVGREINNHFNMSTFLDGIAPLEQLRSFKIFQEKDREKNSIESGDLVITFNPTKSYDLPNIIAVHIETWISEGFNFKRFLRMFSTDLKEITLTKIYLSSIQSFLQTLKTLNKSRHLPLARINLSIALWLDDFSDLKQLPYPLITVKNIFIALDIVISAFERQVLDQRCREAFQNVSKNVNASITLIIPRNLLPGDHSKRSIQIMKNSVPYREEADMMIDNYIKTHRE